MHLSVVLRLGGWGGGIYEARTGSRGRVFICSAEVAARENSINHTPVLSSDIAQRERCRVCSTCFTSDRTGRHYRQQSTYDGPARIAARRAGYRTTVRKQRHLSSRPEKNVRTAVVVVASFLSSSSAARQRYIVNHCRASVYVRRTHYLAMHAAMPV